MSVFDDFSREMRKSEAMAGKPKLIISSDTRNEFKHLTRTRGRCFFNAGNGRQVAALVRDLK